MGRRVKKTVCVYESSAFNLQSTYLYVYDGWNLIEELDDSLSVQKTYVWGLDLSQSTQGAGGVGGLIAVVDDSVTYLYSYDGNGNVGQVIDATDGSVGAHYEYDPYGNLINQSGVYADENAYRFSTKFYDEGTRLFYYGYRYYSADLGRWLSRDPLGERGGKNLYHFVENDPIYGIDLLGLRDTMSRDDYWNMWKRIFPNRDPAFDSEREDTLDRGCVGITCLTLGEKGMPDYSNCYKTLNLAVQRRDEMERTCVCTGTDQEGGTASPKIFSVHLWNDIGTDGINPDLTFDANNKADLSNWDYDGRPSGSWNPSGSGGVNFDFGYYHSGPGGEGRLLASALI